ncbi:MAG: alcohol dehydrogenase catalytic domain-containing protein [Planctomyces sp.]
MALVFGVFSVVQQLAIGARRGSIVPEIVSVDVSELPGGPDQDQILCRTLQLGICGTDREILHSAAPWVPSGESVLVLGHECLARVEAVGSAVTDWQVGDLAVPAVRRSLPGERRRLDYLPLGRFTERGIFSEHGFSMPLWLDRSQHLYRVPAELADIAVFTEPLAVAEKGINEALHLQRARLGTDVWGTDPPQVLVTGMGPIGFAAGLACVARGWSVTMLGRDRDDTFRARLAQRFGIRYQRLADDTFAVTDLERDGVDLILECTGSDELMVRSTAVLRSCGVMVWLGSLRPPQPPTLDIAGMMLHGLLNNHLHIGCVNSAPRVFHDALNHLGPLKTTHAAELQSLITAKVSLEDSLWHYQHREPQGIKTIIEYPT